jgi:signal transduction histidine kinase
MAELNRVGEELRIANSLKDELLGLVSHELRTPLTGILGCSHLLIRRYSELSPEDRAGLLQDINDHGTRLQRLIENMLVLSRAETAAETNTEPLLLQRVLPPVFEGLVPLKGSRRLNVTFESNLPPVTANSVFMEQVITNLVRNSEKYAAEGTDVEVRIEACRESVAITVADRGAELDQPQIDRMFEAFYRDSANSPRVSGLGLGLPVCKRLTEVQGGSISARPRVGGGLVVTVAVPMAEE